MLVSTPADTFSNRLFSTSSEQAERVDEEEEESPLAGSSDGSALQMVADASAKSAPHILDPDSMEFYEGLGPLVRAYSEMLMASGTETTTARENQAINDVEERNYYHLCYYRLMERLNMSIFRAYQPVRWRLHTKYVNQHGLPA